MIRMRCVRCSKVISSYDHTVQSLKALIPSMDNILQPPAFLPPGPPGLHTCAIEPAQSKRIVLDSLAKSYKFASWSRQAFRFEWGGNAPCTQLFVFAAVFANDPGQYCIFLGGVVWDGVGWGGVGQWLKLC